MSSSLQDVPNEIAIEGKTKNLQLLRQLPDIETVWLSAVNQKEFDFLIDAIDPVNLYIYEMRAADLSALERLEKIERLSLCWNPKAEMLWNMSKNHRLNYLEIEDFKRLHKLNPLLSCRALEELHLSGGVSTPMTIDTLSPLKHLQNLKTLGLSNMKLKDESFELLTHLKGLKALQLSNQFPTEEFARLSVALSQTNCDYFWPYVELDDPIDGKDIMVIGKRKPFLHSTADRKSCKSMKNSLQLFKKNINQMMLKCLPAFSKACSASCNISFV
ncbi:hypothetical protein SAMN05421736_10343 [Evansella caseinilytica]|uniref:Uncharacterized protein n=1 Tax=Evansella caseinilytica TaxID=1503961 RepID=A0A1H3LYE9_9BACI|nr:leucine-rich repeat domain-containing protein [Evansella caseinilytica]SDY69038.1 hypothetical protein SAMN05421736_10343 [Evansella caseinilytica]